MAQNKKFKLNNLKIKKVDFVGEGANMDAHINFFKSKEKPVAKKADSFNDKIKEKAKYQIYDQIWQFISALETSLIDIIRDDEVTDKVSLMNKSLEEFYGATGLAIEAWGNNKLSDYYVGDGEVPKETADIFKGLFLDNAEDDLAEVIKKALEAYNPDEGKKEDVKKEDVKKGDEDDMKVEDINKDKLSDEERAQLDAIIQKAGIVEDGAGSDGKNKPVEKNKPAEDKSNNKEDKQDGEDVFKGLPTAVQEELTALRKFREEQENEKFVSIAKKYEVIGKKPEELAPVLKSLKEAGGAAYETMIGALDAAVESVNNSSIFKEIGSNGHSTGDEGAVIAKVRNIAEDIRKSNPNMTEEQAMAKAWETNPDLMAEYDSEIGG